MSKTRALVILSLTLTGYPMITTSPLAAQASASAIEFVTTQPADQSLARVLLGANVTNVEGHTVGDINDLVFDRSGQINTVVIGVGGFLGVGEKIVAVPYKSLSIGSGGDGARTIVLNASKEALKLAPTFTATEKTTMDIVRDKAVDLGHKTADKANELKVQAGKKIDDMMHAPAKK